jgi:hypothetical protein
MLLGYYRVRRLTLRLIFIVDAIRHIGSRHKPGETVDGLRIEGMPQHLENTSVVRSSARLRYDGHRASSVRASSQKQHLAVDNVEVVCAANRYRTH